MRTLMPVRTAGDKTPIFCINGEPLKFAGYLPPDQPLYGLCDAYHPNFEPPEKITQLAAMYTREIQLVQPKGPYRIIGFSIGGLIAYEIARQLQAKGEEIAYLGMIDPSQPEGIWETGGEWASKRVGWMASVIAGYGNPFKGIWFLTRRFISSVGFRVKARIKMSRVRMHELLGKEMPIELRRLRCAKAIRISARGFTYDPVQLRGSIYLPERPESGGDTIEEEWNEVFQQGATVHWTDSVKRHMEFLEEKNIKRVILSIIEEIEQTASAGAAQPAASSEDGAAERAS